MSYEKKELLTWNKKDFSLFLKEWTFKVMPSLVYVHLGYKIEYTKRNSYF